MTHEQAMSLLAMLPESLAKAVSERAGEKRENIQTAVEELLETGLRAERSSASELDEFIGSWKEDPAFDEAISAFEMIDESLWR